MSDTEVAVVVISSCLLSALIICVGFCVFIWLKKLKTSAGGSSSLQAPAKTILRSPSYPSFHSSDHPYSFVLPTVSVSEGPTTEEEPYSESESTGTRSRDDSVIVPLRPHSTSKLHRERAITYNLSGDRPVRPKSVPIFGPGHTPYSEAPSPSPTPSGTDSQEDTDGRRRYKDYDSATELSPSPERRSASSRNLSFARFSITPQDIARDLYMTPEHSQDESEETGKGGLGKISFSLQYDIIKQQLCITVIGATSLPSKFRKGSADPYVKVTVLPEKHPKFVTKIRKNSLNPIYNEVFTFHLRKDLLDGKALRFSVCDHDKFSRRIVIGYAVFPLKDAFIKSNVKENIRTGEIIRDLMDRVDDTEVNYSKGELLVSLCYKPDREQLNLVVAQARNLKHTEDKDISSVYVKVTLYEGKRVIKSKKTPVKRKTRDPVFNENFSIQLPESYLNEVFCVMAVNTKNKLGVRKLIGKAAVGPFTHVTGSGLDQWDEMMHRPKEIVSQWHALT